MGPGFDRLPGRGYCGLLCPVCLGLLPFAVRLDSQRAPSREGQWDSGPNFSAGPGKGDTPDRGGRTVAHGRIPDARHANHEQSNTFESTTQRR